MKILVINAGSSSLKYQLFDMQTMAIIAKGIVEKIGSQDSFLQYTHGDVQTTLTQPLDDHTAAFTLVVQTLLDPATGVLTTLDELDAIGHRAVHGGEYFKDSVIITDEVIDKIMKCCDLAPLHNPANLQAIHACKTLLPTIPQVAAFDTAFHQTMQPANYLYALPKAYYEQYKIRRYGFHGLSHQYVYEQLLTNYEGQITNSKKTKQDLKVITCHIGNGASVAAIVDGKVIETSMGMTPLEGLVMGTRCGSIDPAIIPYIMRHEGLTPDQMDSLMNKKSGLLGISGISPDMRDIIAGVERHDLQCEITMDMYINSIVKYIGAYTALMGGVDAIVLTAGVMERSAFVRARLMQKLGGLGITFDLAANDFSSGEHIISAPDSQVHVVVIPTNEELMIAKETFKLIKHQQ